MGRKRKREVWWRRVCRKKNGERNGDPRTIRSQNCGRDGRESRKVKYTVLCEGWVDAGGEMWESKKRGSRRGPARPQTPDHPGLLEVVDAGVDRGPWSCHCVEAQMCVEDGGDCRCLSVCGWHEKGRQ